MALKKATSMTGLPSVQQRPLEQWEVTGVGDVTRGGWWFMDRLTPESVSQFASLLGSKWPRGKFKFKNEYFTIRYVYYDIATVG